MAIMVLAHLVLVLLACNAHERPIRDVLKARRKRLQLAVPALAVHIPAPGRILLELTDRPKIL